MSNRKSDDKGLGRNQGNKKFYPKYQVKSISDHQKLSDSIRHSSSRQSDAPSSGGARNASPAASRIKVGEDGEWVSNNGNFVNYLPQDEAVASGLSADEGALDPLESQRVVDLLNRELSRLLKLRPRDFWREVASDTSLHAFLESFLKYRSRWYDFPYHGAKGVVAGVIVGEFDLCRRVFMLLYRLSSNRDPGARNTDSLSSKDHEALLQEKKLLDLPKLLDICAIYAQENEDLTRLLVMNSVKAQPQMHDEFIAVATHFLNIVHTMHERCSSSLEVLFSSGDLQKQGLSSLRMDYLEVIDFINDAVVTVDAFVGAYNPAGIFFSCPVDVSYGNMELLTTLARLHDLLLPSLQKGLHIVFASGEHTLQEAPSTMLSEVSLSLKLLSIRIVNLAWKLLYFCYLSDEAFETGCPFPTSMKMFPANIGDPVIRADILLQTIRDITEECSHSHEVCWKGTFLQDIAKNHKLISRVGLLRNAGWISMDDEQFKFLLSILGCPVEVNNIKETPHMPSPGTGNIQRADEDTAILESKISQIKDLFPEYGKGFLAVCLEAYNQNPEEVIQRILENTLHKDLQSLDISLEEIPPRKSTPVSMLDKGKGKLVESSLPSLTNRISYPPEGPSRSSLSSVGRYTRKAISDLPAYEALDSRDEKHVSKTVALIAQLEYEDEYDDSFDELGISVGGDSWLEETEIPGDKVTSGHEKSMEVDSGKSSTSKWNSRKKPQYYVKDGKNYAYKVEGSVAVANYNEASILNQAQRETIYGLGRGGNIPLGAVRRLTESNEVVDEHNSGEVEAPVGRGQLRGRGRKGREPGPGHGNFHGRGRGGGEAENDEVEGQDSVGNFRGRGRRGGGRNNYRKDQAMKKHLSGLRG